MDEVMYLIAGAVKAAASHQDRGLSLEDALVKAAVDHDLTVEQTKRVVENLNTLNTLEQFKMGNKTAEFPVADVRDVVAEVFREKSAQALPAPPLPLEYVADEVSRFIPHQERLLLKQAHDLLSRQTARSQQHMTQYHRDPHELAAMVGQEIDGVEKQAFEHEVSAQRCKDSILMGMDALAWSFQRHGAPTLSRFSKDASAVWKGQGRDYLKLLGKMVPKKFHGAPVEKAASLVDGRTEQHKLFKMILEAEKDFVTHTKEASGLREQARGWKEGLRAALFGQGIDKEAAPPMTITPEQIELKAQQTAYGPLAPGQQQYPPLAQQMRPSEVAQLRAQAERTLREEALRTAPPSPAEQERERLDLQSRRQQAVSQPFETGERVGRLTGDAAQATLGMVPAGKLVPGVAGFIGGLEPFIGPPKDYDYYDALAETLKIQSSVQQVLDEDPILAERSPEELMPIIETLIQVAPDVVSHPPTLSAILRQATSGQYETLDPLTLSQLAEAQQNIWKNKEIRRRRLLDQEIGLRI